MDGIVAAGGTAQPGPDRSIPARVRTNFVLFRVERDRAAFLAALRARDVEMVEYPHGQVRAVTHYGVTSEDIDTTIEATRAALDETSRTVAASGRRHRPDPARSSGHLPATARQPSRRTTGAPEVPCQP